MQSKFFWKDWPNPYKGLYLSLLILFFGSIIWMFYGHISGLEGWLEYDILAQSESVKTVIESFKAGPFTLYTEADNTIFFQKFSGGLPEVNVLSYYIFLTVTALCMLVLLTVVTTLPRFWFFVGTSLFIIVLVNLKLETLLLFGSQSKVGLIIALTLYVPLAYALNAFKSNVSFLKRLAVFIGVTVILALIITLFAEVNSPFLYLATYGMINPLLISLVFILLVAHEIIAGFVYILTRSSTGTSKSNNLLHFAIITVVYLINLLLAYLHETRIIDWDFLYINLFVLLGISAVLGIWSYSQREPQFETFFKFKPVGAFYYLALAICCFVTLGHFMATGNDPAVEVFRDFIIYSHIGYGLIFLIYILSNFLDPFKNNLPVYKVLYKPLSMPYFTFRLAGLIALTALVLKSNWQVPVNQSFSAYYNGLGDLHYSAGESLLAKRYYEEGALFGFNNHKSNYSLATIAETRQDAQQAINRYTIATKKWPTPQAYINLSNVYADNDRFFDALFTLQDAADKFPDNGRILNNLGLTYSKTSILDTAAIFLEKAFKDKSTKATAGSNLLSLLAKNDIPTDPDSVIATYEIEKDPISINNTIVLYNKLKAASTEQFDPRDSTLSYLQATLLYNDSFNYLFRNDSLYTTEVEAYAEVDDNINHRKKLRLVSALNLEKNHDINQAFRKLNWLANSHPQSSASYFSLLGLWALKHEVPSVAIDYFRWAADKNHQNADLNLAIAYMENGQLESAIDQWNSLLESKDRNTQIMANNMLSMLSAKPGDLSTDSERYLYVRYKTGFYQHDQFEELLQKIEDDNYKAAILLDMVKKQWGMDYEDAAITYFSQLTDLKITDKKLFEEIQWYELRMLAAQGNIRGLAKKINQGIGFDEERMLEKNYYSGLVSEASGDTLQARKHYEAIAYKNPFFVESVIAAANFLGINDKFEAYNILLSALEVNPRSVRLLKAYIFQCARIEHTTYAELSLETLSRIIPVTDYQKFKKEYEELAAKVSEEANNW